MPFRRRLLAVLTIAVLAGCGGYEAEIDAWHADRLERLRAEDGWLSLVGLHPLREGANAVGSAEGADVRLVDAAPAELGVLEVRRDQVRFTAAADADVRRDDDGRPVEAVEMITDAAGAPTVLTSGSLSFHVIARGGGLYLRVKDRESAVRAAFTGIDRFPVDAAWRVEARLELFDEPRMIDVPDALGHTSPSPCPGRLIFQIRGKTQTLLPLGDPSGELFVVFEDRSTGVDTYGAGRFLYTGVPDADGTVIVDFNKAYNPPCAFTPYATCPRPPEGNALEVYVEAGERAWGAH